MSDAAANPLRLKLIAIRICSACLDGVGQECHTPGCALFLHRVDLPVHVESYQVLHEEEVEE